MSIWVQTLRILHTRDEGSEARESKCPNPEESGRAGLTKLRWS